MRSNVDLELKKNVKLVTTLGLEGNHVVHVKALSQCTLLIFRQQSLWRAVELME